MKYIKVFVDKDVANLQNKIDKYSKETEHDVVDQSCSASPCEESFLSRTIYMVTVTYSADNGEIK